MSENSISANQAQNQEEIEETPDSGRDGATRAAPRAARTTTGEHYTEPTTREELRLRNKSLETAKEVLKAR